MIVCAEPVTPIEVGLTVQVSPVIAPLHVNATVPVYPETPAAVNCSVAELPFFTVAEAVVVASVKSPPVPVRAIGRGLEVPLLVIVTVPLSAPVPPGVKLTVSVQNAPAASVVPQLLDCA